MIELSIAIGNYDRHQALRDGRVRPEGLQLHFAASRTREIFWRMLRHQDFDVAEMSLSSYTIAQEFVSKSAGLNNPIAYANASAVSDRVTAYIKIYESYKDLLK